MLRYLRVVLVRSSLGSAPCLHPSALKLERSITDTGRSLFPLALRVLVLIFNAFQYRYLPLASGLHALSTEPDAVATVIQRISLIRERSVQSLLDWCLATD